MNDFWNQKYDTPTYLYGVEPNQFIKNQLQQLEPGKILFPAEGEGRNAVYAAKLGWEVTAFDTSHVAREKALKLAELNQVTINYQLVDYQSATFASETFDVIALTFTHIPGALRSKMHQKYLDWLKPDGLLLLEAFSKEQLNYNSGGPKDVDLLFSTDNLSKDFAGGNIRLLEEKLRELKEGNGHLGLASTIQCIVKKN